MAGDYKTFCEQKVRLYRQKKRKIEKEEKETTYFV